jgi:hypothetical protein
LLAEVVLTTRPYVTHHGDEGEADESGHRTSLWGIPGRYSVCRVKPDEVPTATVLRVEWPQVRRMLYPEPLHAVMRSKSDGPTGTTDADPAPGDQVMTAARRWGTLVKLTADAGPLWGIVR